MKALFNQRVRPPGIFAGDLAGNGVYIAILLDGARRGEPGSALPARFDNQNADIDAAEPTVAPGRFCGAERSRVLVLGDDGAPSGEYLFGQPFIFLGIDTIDDGSQMATVWDLAARAPLWAAVSTPRAMPLRMISPRRARSRDSISAAGQLRRSPTGRAASHRHESRAGP